MTVFQNVNLVSDGSVKVCDVGVSNGFIVAISNPNTLQGDIIQGKSLYLSHGFIDIHVHGGGGYDFMDSTIEAWHGASALHLRFGTTGMVPTTLAASEKELTNAFKIYNECKNGFEDSTKFLGVHVEGPYLAPGQNGAQNPKYIRAPQAEEYMRLCEKCDGIIRWTTAPELEGAAQMGDYLASRGILSSIGHSDATYDEVLASIKHGYHHVTHLYSAMSTIVRKQGFRHAGIIESAYLLNELTSEIIADGCHLPKSLLQMAYRFISPERLCLVTDAMRAAGQTEGESTLGSLDNGQRVILEDGVAKMPDRSAFAGSICTADRLVRNMITLAGATLPNAVKMITETPSRILKLENKTGFVKIGRVADLVLFDENIQIKLVMTNGIVRHNALNGNLKSEDKI